MEMIKLKFGVVKNYLSLTQSVVSNRRKEQQSHFVLTLRKLLKQLSFVTAEIYLYPINENAYTNYSKKGYTSGHFQTSEYH